MSRLARRPGSTAEQPAAVARSRSRRLCIWHVLVGDPRVLVRVACGASSVVGDAHPLEQLPDGARLCARCAQWYEVTS